MPGDEYFICPSATFKLMESTAQLFPCLGVKVRSGGKRRFLWPPATFVACARSLSGAGSTDYLPLLLLQSRLCTSKFGLATPLQGAKAQNTHTHTHTHTHARARAHTHACTHARTHTHMHTHARMHTHKHARTHAHAHIFIHKYTHAHATRVLTHTRACEPNHSGLYVI